MGDTCCKRKRHPAEIKYKDKWWCMDCWDKETDKDMDKQKEIRTVKTEMIPEFRECECGAIKVRGVCPICQEETK